MGYGEAAGGIGKLEGPKMLHLWFYFGWPKYGDRQKLNRNLSKILHKRGKSLDFFAELDKRNIDYDLREAGNGTPMMSYGGLWIYGIHSIAKAIASEVMPIVDEFPVVKNEKN